MPDQPPLAHCFHLQNSFSSESAHVFICRYISSIEHQKILWSENDEVVLKILIPYEDIRFDHLKLEKRQKSQIEALKWNRIFTPDVYIGIAPIIEPNPILAKPTEICIGEIITEIDILNKKTLDGEDMEYALVMKRLPDAWRLDILWQNLSKQEQIIRILLERIVHMHTETFFLPDISIQNNKEEPFLSQIWGSIEQICDKLEHNIQLFSQIPPNYRALKPDLYDHITTILTTLLKNLTTTHYRLLFEQRVNEQRIKRCHGDLKCTNIWIMPAETEQSILAQVKILDAIDFSPQYSMIDILSDFAMLAVDLLAHTATNTPEPSIIKSFINDYMKSTNQQDEVTQAILYYYMFEKAIVCASVGTIAPEYDFETTTHFYQQFLEMALFFWEQLNEVTNVLHKSEHC